MNPPGTRSFTRACVSLALAVLALFSHRPEAANLHPGLFEEPVAVGLNAPTAMQFAPDGRLFIGEQNGTIRIVKDGQLLPAPFLQLTVNGSGSGGLLGLEFDPDFEANPYVYVYYTTATQPRHNRVSRFTASGDVAVAGSETILLELDDQTSGGHNGGALHFGTDGTLFVAVGENNVGAHSQTLDNFFGKILRINSDGTIPPDNPFVGSATGQYAAIWALGLRNPFTFAVQPGTGRLFINDVGQSTWEEINEGAAGANYGWPDYEGPTSEPSFASPLHWYGHGSTSSTGCAITGGTFYNPQTPQFSELVGHYFFSDYCGGWIRHLDPAQPSVSIEFATGIASPVDLKVGPEGALYYLARDQGAVYRILAPEAGHFVLTARVEGSGAGQITSSPGDLSCPSVTCTDSFADGSVVELTATPSTGSTFTGWGGDCNGAGSCFVTLDEARTVTATFESGYDLLISVLSDPPAFSTPGGVFSVSDTTVNQGVLATPGSTTRFLLSVDVVLDASDRLLTGTHVVASLPPGTRSPATTTVTVPANIVIGTYWLLACADHPQAILEADEANNCVASTVPIEIDRPDLVETDVIAAASSVAPGGTLGATDTTLNQGAATATASVTRYYFSVDAMKSADDIRLTGTRAAGAIPGGGQSSGSATLTVPSTVAVGPYVLLACADDTAVVAERNETNNCVAATGAVTVARPDLVQTAISNPPASGSPGGSFSVTDTVQNSSDVSSVKATTTRYYLSENDVKDAGDTLLATTRAIPILPGGAVSTGTRTVKIPASMALGTYVLLSCADDTNAILESAEGNNCLRAVSTLLVSLPDLVTTTLSNPPSTVAPATTFAITDTVSNQGSAAAVASTTRYLLSIDGIKDGSDVLLSGTRSVPALAAGATSTGSRTVTVPATTVLGTYLLLACADDLAKAAEINESNNCRVSTTTVTVGRPDLVVSSLSDPPPAVVRGRTFTVTDTTRNQGDHNAGTSTTRYYLSLDGSRNAGDVLLSATRTVPTLLPGAASTGSRTVTVPAAIAPGLYFLLACADDLVKVSELQESNNCTAAGSVDVQP